MRSVKQHIWVQVVSEFLLLQYISCDCLLPEIDFPHGNIKLPDLVEIENQTFVKELFVLKFTCSDGYMQIGHEYLQCVDGNWSSTPPFCADRKCPDPPVVTNATYDIESGVNVDPAIGSVAVYSCEDGFELVNKSVSSLKCKVNMESRESAWEGEVPACQKKTSCPDPGHSKHGSYSGDSFLSGDTIRFSCEDGYELVGNTEMQCLKNGNWSSSRPLCKPLSPHCEMPSEIEHGVVTGKKAGDYFQPDEEAQVLCEPGYKCVGETFVLCLNEGRWRDEFGVCKKIFCERPPNLTNGTIQNLNNLTSFPYDYELTYVCDEGYRIYGGDSWRTCDKNGWSGRKPRCEPTRCPDPGIPENGMKIGTNYRMGSRVRFTCFTDYDLLGSEERICKSNGEWTGETARCNIKSNYCPDPGTPIGGFKNMTEYRKGDRVRFRCQPGSFMLGSDVRECLENRTWSGKPTKCVGKYDFDNNAEVRDMLQKKLLEKKQQQKRELDRYHAVQKQLGNGAFPGRILDINYPGRIILYFAFDVSGSIKRGNFQKSIDFAKTIVRKVNITEDGARAGAVTFGSRAEPMFMPLDYKSTEEVLDAFDRINYTGGGTAASSALNLIRREFMPLVKEVLGDKDIKSVIFILTDGKANMGGDPKKEAQQLKDEGVEIFCVGITGDVRKKSLFEIASTSLYGEETRANVFILQDYRMLAWVVDELTKGSINYSQCGLDREKIGANTAKIVGGNVTVEPWPWMAALEMSVGNNRDNRKFQCGGSIVHRRFILTAAHCMYYEKEKKILQRKAGEIIVKLGLTKRNNGSNLQEIEVRRIHLHPNYKNSMNNLDYDITLLELKQPITFNEFVRPICLPPPELAENSPFYRPGLPVWAIGFGYTKVLAKDKDAHLPSQELKEISLPIVQRETCTKSLEGEIIAPVFTERMFCAGTGEGKQDTCKGDSGGPVMQSDLNGEGYLAWTQVGVISWGLGCGLKHEYGFYTHLQRLMPWVDNTTAMAIKWMQEGT